LSHNGAGRILVLFGTQDSEQVNRRQHGEHHWLKQEKVCRVTWPTKHNASDAGCKRWPKQAAGATEPGLQQTTLTCSKPNYDTYDPRVRVVGIEPHAESEVQVSSKANH
jgi:hypothetical protein